MKRVKYHRNVSPIMMFSVPFFNVFILFYSFWQFSQFFFSLLLDVFVCKFRTGLLVLLVYIKCLAPNLFVGLKIAICYVKRSLAGNRSVLAEKSKNCLSLLLTNCCEMANK